MQIESDLDRLTSTRGELARPASSGRLACVACAHRCRLGPGRLGACLVRRREGDLLRVPWGFTAGVAVDPIEKKPFFHVLPGATALSFGMLGCNFRCDYCQNWWSSQSLRDPASGAQARPMSADDLVAAAFAHSCASVVSTYNEPLVTAEWAREVFVKARALGLLTGFVSNGFATIEVLDYLAPAMDLFKVDLKAFREATYRRLGGRLAPVLETIRSLHERGVWVEVVTLVVPGLNDDPSELREMAEYLESVSSELPWHLTAFHPDYRMADGVATTAPVLRRAVEIGREAGLRFVYAGNLSGGVQGGEDTRCPGCGELLVERRGMRVLWSGIGVDGMCPSCERAIPGVWRRPEGSRPRR